MINSDFKWVLFGFALTWAASIAVFSGRCSTASGIRRVDLAQRQMRQDSAPIKRAILRLDRSRSAPAAVALLGQVAYRRDGNVIYSDAGCFLRRQWKAAPALERPASFHVLADSDCHRDAARRSRRWCELEISPDAVGCDGANVGRKEEAQVLGGTILSETIAVLRCANVQATHR